MTINMLVFDYRENEREFFENNELQNFDFTFFKESLNPRTVKTIPQEVKDKANVISVFTNSEVNEEVINSFKNLRIISTRSTAYEHISKKAANERNIAVINVTKYGETSVAQFTFCLILALTRKLVRAVKDSDKNTIDDNDFYELTGRDISKLSIGIVGTGTIGAAVCKIAKTFNMDVYGCDINVKQELINKYGIKYLPFEELIKKVDIVTLHIPFTGDNLHMFDKTQFDMMKENSYFINTSSRRLVNFESLYNALKDGKIAGAALDTTCCTYLNAKCFENGKLAKICMQEYKYLHLLSEMENAIVTPHIAYNTQESINYILQSTIDQIRETIKCGDVNGIF